MYHKQVFVIFLFCLFLNKASADSAIVYVCDASGSNTNNCTTAALPCQTVEHAINTVTPIADNSTIEVRMCPSTYTEAGNFNVKLPNNNVETIFTTWNSTTEAIIFDCQQNYAIVFNTTSKLSLNYVTLSNCELGISIQPNLQNYNADLSLNDVHFSNIVNSAIHFNSSISSLLMNGGSFTGSQIAIGAQNIKQISLTNVQFNNQSSYSINSQGNSLEAANIQNCEFINPGSIVISGTDNTQASITSNTVTNDRVPSLNIHSLIELTNGNWLIDQNNFDGGNSFVNAITLYNINNGTQISNSKLTTFTNGLTVSSSVGKYSISNTTFDASETCLTIYSAKNVSFSDLDLSNCQNNGIYLVYDNSAANLYFTNLNLNNVGSSYIQVATETFGVFQNSTFDGDNSFSNSANPSSWFSFRNGNWIIQNININSPSSMVDNIFSLTNTDGFSSFSLINNDFQNNNNQDPDSYFPTPIVIKDSTLKVKDCSFSKFMNNVVKNGSAIHISNTPTSIINSVFKNCTNQMLGGAIYIESSPLEISGCDFTGNSATNGGAISILDSTIAGNFANITNCNFTENSAVQFGGAIDISDSVANQSSIFINDCNFSGNVASTGAAIDCCDNSTDCNLSVFYESAESNSFASNENVAVNGTDVTCVVLLQTIPPPPSSSEDETESGLSTEEIVWISIGCVAAVVLVVVLIVVIVLVVIPKYKASKYTEI